MLPKRAFRWCVKRTRHRLTPRATDSSNRDPSTYVWAWSSRKTGIHFSGSCSRDADSSNRAPLPYVWTRHLGKTGTGFSSSCS